MIHEEDLALLRRLGIIVKDVQATQKTPSHWGNNYGAGDEPVELEVSGEFIIDEESFRPMCHLIRITEMIARSRNPAVEEMYQELVTLLFLTEKNKGE